MHEQPDRLLMGLHAARRQFSGELAQREGAGTDPLAQPLGMDPGQHALLVAIHLSRLQIAGLTPQLLPL